MAYPKINSVGWTFREVFYTPATVMQNGGSIGTGITVDNGATSTGSDGIDYDKAYVPESGEFSIYLKGVSTDLSSVNGLLGQYFDVAANRMYVALTTGGVARIQIGTDIIDTSNSVAEGEEFEIFVTRDSANLVSITLNNGTAGTATVATDIDQQPMTLLSYQEGGGIGYLTGALYECRIYDRALSDSEMGDISNGTTYQETDDSQALLVLPLRASYDDGSSQVTDNEGSLGGTVQLGNGSSASTFPSQLSPKGMSFDGGDYLFSDDTGLQVTGDVTFGGIIRADSEAQSLQGSIMLMTANGETEATNTLYGIQLAGGSTDLYYIHEYGAGSNEFHDTTYDMVVGKPTHVYLVRRDEDSEVDVYVDGELFNTISYTNSATGGSSTDLWMGSLYLTSNTYFEGAIIEPRIFDSALTETQIKWLYQKDINLINQ